MNAKQRRDWRATRDMFQRAREIRSVEESPSGATMAGRRPYQCPCCDGYGKRQVIRAMMTNIVFEPCHSCGGTGVVLGMICGTFGNTPIEHDPFAFVLGHGETLIGHWYAQGHALVKFQRAIEPRPPGTVVTGQHVDIDPDVPAVYLIFEDAAALYRMRDYLDDVARGLVEASAREDDK